MPTSERRRHVADNRQFMKYAAQLLCLAGCLLTGAAGFVIGRPSSNRGSKDGTAQPSRAGDRSADVGDSDVRSALLRLDQRLQLLELKQAISAAAPSPQPSAQPIPARTEPLAAPEPQTQPVDEEIQKRITTESRDRAWSAMAEESIRTAAQETAGDKGGYSITSLSCLTSLCKAKMSLPSLDGPAGTMYGFPFNVRGMAGFRKIGPTKEMDGAFTIEYVFYRKGYNAPGRDEEQRSAD